jgi:hypothetical protein
MGESGTPFLQPIFREYIAQCFVGMPLLPRVLEKLGPKKGAAV